VGEPLGATSGPLKSGNRMATPRKITFRTERDHEFSVIWNRERSRFDVYRDARRTPSFSYQRGTAVGIAIREAQQEAMLTGQKIIVTSTNIGKRVIEWSSL
jgi:hypothetical protein